MEFIVDKENNQINVEREFDAPLEMVWAAWTQSEILDQWWAPKPYVVKTKSMDFSVGGTWLYAMISPDGSEHWSRADYQAINDQHSFTALDGFCNEHGEINDNLPRQQWKNTFRQEGSSTIVSIVISFTKLEDLETIIKMGFKEGFTSGLENLDHYLQERTKPVIVQQTVNASAAEVWQAITDKEQMKQWYFDLEEFKPVVGFTFRFTGQGPKGETYIHLCEVKEVIPMGRLTYSWSYEGFEGISFVTFELASEGNQTRVTLTHKGLHSFPEDNPDFAKENFNQGWNQLIKKSLKEYLESGRSTG